MNSTEIKSAFLFIVYNVSLDQLSLLTSKEGFPEFVCTELLLKIDASPGRNPAKAEYRMSSCESTAVLTKAV